MASIFKLTDEHIKLIESFLPKVRRVERVHLKETLNGMPKRQSQKGLDHHQTLPRWKQSKPQEGMP